MSASPVVLPPNESLPSTLRAGDQLAWSVQTGLAAGKLVWYTLSAVVGNVPVRYTIAQPDGTLANPGVAVDGTGLAAFAVPSATTAGWSPGRYKWVAFASDVTGNRIEIARGTLRILPDDGGLNPVDPRSYNERMLDAIRCLLEGKALDDAIMYKLGNRELTKLPIADLTKWELQFETRVRNERIRRGEYVPTKTRGITFGGRGR